ncbi:MAG: hypothetical protein ACKVUS_13445 [Saprospiraceae bacterium]
MLNSLIKFSLQNRLSVMASTFLLTLTLHGCGKEKEVYDFQGGFRVKAYCEATGFMDAGTVFEVYHRDEGFWGLEKRIGYAVNWSVDYLSAPPKPEIVLIEGAVVVIHRFGIDTLKIQPNKYLNY